MIDALEKAHPGIKERICDEQATCGASSMCSVNEEDIRFDDNLNTSCRPARTSHSSAIAAAAAAKRQGRRSCGKGELAKESATPPRIRCAAST